VGVLNSNVTRQWVGLLNELLVVEYYSQLKKKLIRRYSVNQTFNSTKGTGRRKSVVATVELVRGTGKFTIISLVLIICNKKQTYSLLFKPH
jgi:hypothetical protein